jgi:hypothetical protein
MKQDQFHSSIGKGLAPLYWDAFLFAIFGSLICMMHGVFSYFILSFVGWGDGSSGMAISNPVLCAVLFTLPLFTYFLLGTIASTSTRRVARIVLAWGAHIFLPIFCFLSLWAIVVSNPAVVLLLIFFVAYVVIVITFSVCWRKLLKERPKAEQGVAADRQPLPKFNPNHPAITRRHD